MVAPSTASSARHDASSSAKTCSTRRRVDRLGGGDARGHPVDAEIGADEPHSGGHAGGPRDGDGVDAERSGQPGHVHRSGAAEARRGAKSRGSMPRCTVTTWMAAAMSALTTSCTARAASASVEPEGLGHRMGQAHPRPTVESDTPPARRDRVEVAEHQVGVGHRRLGAAAAVAGRPGHGPRRPGADPQRAAGVDPRDAAAAGADLGQVDDGDLDREAGARAGAAEAALAADLEVVGDPGRPSAHDARLGRGAAHVERDAPRRHRAGGRAKPAAMTPAAPPDSTVYTGRRAASAADMTPPLDSMISTGQRDAQLAQALARARSGSRVITGPT